MRVLQVYNAEITSELLEKRRMQLKFYSATPFFKINHEEGFFLKVGRWDSKVLVLEYLDA